MDAGYFSLIQHFFAKLTYDLITTAKMHIEDFFISPARPEPEEDLPVERPPDLLIFHYFIQSLNIKEEYSK